ncbi:MAG: hypothetical protein H7138_25240 [Myxococcales bacterium]|nr:hypothetical protein [Myxococcales bacterium]
MKKPTGPRGAIARPIATIDRAALADASAGTGTQTATLVEPYVGQQHNETIVRDRHQVARRGGAGRAADRR